MAHDVPMFIVLCLLYLQVLDYCICFVNTSSCTNIQFIIHLAWFCVCAVSVKFLSLW